MQKAKNNVPVSASNNFQSKFFVSFIPTHSPSSSHDAKRTSCASVLCISTFLRPSFSFSISPLPRHALFPPFFVSDLTESAGPVAAQLFSALPRSLALSRTHSLYIHGYQCTPKNCLSCHETRPLPETNKRHARSFRKSRCLFHGQCPGEVKIWSYQKGCAKNMHGILILQDTSNPYCDSPVTWLPKMIFPCKQWRIACACFRPSLLS